MAPNQNPSRNFNDRFGTNDDPDDADFKYGIVKRLVADKGFGFIIPDQGGREVFFHRTECLMFDQLAQGDRVKYVPVQSVKGPRGQQVEPAGVDGR